MPIKTNEANRRPAEPAEQPKRDFSFLSDINRGKQYCPVITEEDMIEAHKIVQEDIDNYPG